MLKKLLLGAIPLIGISVLGCGDDDDSTTGASGSSAAAGSSGNAGVGGTSGAGGSGASSGGSSGSAGTSSTGPADIGSSCDDSDCVSGADCIVNPCNDETEEGCNYVCRKHVSSCDAGACDGTDFCVDVGTSGGFCSPPAKAGEYCRDSVDPAVACEEGFSCALQDGTSVFKCVSTP